jgi:hypothetical protein
MSLSSFRAWLYRLARTGPGHPEEPSRSARRPEDHRQADGVDPWEAVQMKRLPGFLSHAKAEFRATAHVSA